MAISELIKIADVPIDEEILNAKNAGRRPRISEEDACALMREQTGAGSAAAFRRLSEEQQRKVIIDLWNHGISIRQASRISGLSKGIVERWSHVNE